MSRALMAIPPNPRRCRDLRPAFSTRKSWRTDTGRSDVLLNHTNTNTCRDQKRADVTHRNHGEDGVDDSGPDGGVDGLLDTGRLKDTRRVVEHLRRKQHVYYVIFLIAIWTLVNIRLRCI